MNKISGVAAELLFRHICIKKNIISSVPDLDAGCGFDCITSYDGKLQKVQIKSTNSITKTGGYKILAAHGSKNKHKYTKDHCDFLAAYISDIDVWYIIPIEKITGVTVNIYPDKLNHRYSKYKSAWYLLAS
tara:strand:- start:190 stop:582 length:393 start_codon:yes stop_codon:yes gene_type:complete